MTTTHDEHSAPPEAWDAIAAGYDSYVAPQEADLANEALDLAGLERGHRFLDVAAGPGGLSLPAARRGAEVLATDWSGSMLDQLRRRAAAEGLTSTECRVMDCHRLDLPDDSFDVTGSQFGVMLVPDQAQALREMVRVTRPGGRVVLIAYADPERFEVLQVFLAALKAVSPDFDGIPDDPPPLEFQLADPDVFRHRLAEAGLHDITITRTDERPAFASGQELWDWTYWSNPVVEDILSDVGEDARARLRQVLDGILRERADEDGRVVLANAVHIGVGIA